MTVIGEKDIEVVLVAQIEAAVSGPRSVKDLHPSLLDVHTDWVQLFSVALPLVCWRGKAERNRNIIVVIIIVFSFFSVCKLNVSYHLSLVANID